MSRKSASIPFDSALPILAVTFPDGTERIYAISSSGLIVGSSPGNALYIPDRELASRHAEVLLGEDGGVELVDLDSGYGTFVNGVSVRRCWLEEGDEVWFGEARARFSTGQERLAGTERAPCQTDDGLPPLALLNEPGIEPDPETASALQEEWTALRGEQEQLRRDRLQFETAKRKHLEKERSLFETGEPHVLLETSRQELRRLKQRSEEFALELEAKHQERLALEAEFGKLRKAIAEAVSEQDETRKRVAELHQERTQTQESLASVARLSVRAKLEWSTQLEKLRHACAAEERCWQTLVTRREALRKEVTATRQELAEAKESWLAFERTAQTQRALLDQERLERLAEIEAEMESLHLALMTQRESFETVREAMEMATLDRQEALGAAEALRAETSRLREEIDRRVEQIAELASSEDTLRTGIQDLQRKEQALVERLQMLHRQQLRTAS
jgi:pSer/pThr/pTyr-binding forkhead associated (FHA) protein